MLGTSADFIIASEQNPKSTDEIGQNMGFELAKQGFDVWLTNNRGSRYGMDHLVLSSKKSKFWDFSFDEIARFDVSAFVDYVTNVTGQSKYWI